MQIIINELKNAIDELENALEKALTKLKKHTYFCGVFEKGEFYKYLGDAEEIFWKDTMNFMLDAKFHRCARADGDYAIFGDDPLRNYNYWGASKHPELWEKLC